MGPVNHLRLVLMVRLTFRVVFGLVLAIATLETVALGIYLLLTLPSSIPFHIAKTAFEKIIDVDAALLGFTGVIVAVSIQTWKKRYRYSLAVLASVVAFLLISLVISIGELAGGTPVSIEAFYYSLEFLVFAVMMLFAGLATI